MADPPSGEWHIDGGTRYRLTVPVDADANALVDSLFDQLDIDEDGDVSFTGWLGESQGQVGLYAGQHLVGYLTPDAAEIMRQEMTRRRRGVVQVDTFVSQVERTVLAGTAWLSPPRRR